MKKVLSIILVLALAATLLCGCGLASTDTASDNGGDTASQTVKADKVKVIDIPLSEEEYAFAVAKTNTELLTKANEYLKKIVADGTFDDICDHYFGEGTPNKFESAKKDASKDQLVVATATGFEPFEMVDNGKYYGIDLEIAAGLAAYLGKELVIEDMQFASVCTSVESGICDIGMAGLTITPARQKVLSFTDSYYNASQILLVKGDNTEYDACKTKEDVEKILNAKDAKCQIGCQNGTTGAIYVEGDADDEDGYGFKGLSVTLQTYDYAALAAAAMVNGEIDYVIVDNAPGKAIAKALNK